MKGTHQNTTILVIVTGLLVLSYIFKAPILVTISTVIAVVSLIIPGFGRIIEWGWYKIAHVLGWINTRILLSLVFYIFLLPFALLARISGKNSLKLRRLKDSVFTKRDHVYTKKDFENMW